jgi:hypothetical protein
MTQRAHSAASATFAGGLMLFLLAACSGGSAPNKPAGAQHFAAQPAQDPLAGASRAPGNERLQPDEHPELAHLTQVSTDSLADAITSYVASESKGRKGAFPVPAPDGGEPLALTLTTVHRERVSRLADGRYFACADFKGADGNTYDVDIFMRAESKGLVPADIIVHKVNGAPRFNWIERDGAWSAVPVSK